MADATERKPAAEEPTTYHVDRLIADASGFFDVPRHVVAGALSGETKKNFTLDEVKDAIKAYNKHEVEVDNPVGSNQLDEEGRA